MLLLHSSFQEKKKCMYRLPYVHIFLAENLFSPQFLLFIYFIYFAWLFVVFTSIVYSLLWPLVYTDCIPHACKRASYHHCWRSQNIAEFVFFFFYIGFHVVSAFIRPDRRAWIHTHVQHIKFGWRKEQKKRRNQWKLCTPKKANKVSSTTPHHKSIWGEWASRKVHKACGNSLFAFRLCRALFLSSFSIMSKRNHIDA